MKITILVSALYKFHYYYDYYYYDYYYYDDYYYYYYYYQCNDHPYSTIDDHEIFAIKCSKKCSAISIMSILLKYFAYGT